eukprot:10474580-Alexandrium_andersonii.AAC.1
MAAPDREMPPCEDTTSPPPCKPGQPPTPRARPPGPFPFPRGEREQPRQAEPRACGNHPIHSGGGQG